MYKKNMGSLFKKWLVDEIKSKTNAQRSDIIKEVDLFSKTEEYQVKFNNWKKVFNKKIFSENPVKHILVAAHNIKTKDKP